MKKYISAKELKEVFTNAGIDEGIINKIHNIKYKGIELVVVHEDENKL